MFLNRLRSRAYVLDIEGEYEKPFIGFDRGTSLMKLLQGVEFGVSTWEDHPFEVETQGNVDADGMVSFMDARMRYGLPMVSKGNYTCYGYRQGSKLEYSKGVRVQGLQQEVGTYFVEGTFHTLIGG
ncbi:hypothetical protein Tco_0903780 [Tanacetum coccineum]